MRRILRRPHRPLPDWWPEGRPWPPPEGARPMPAWWPQNEPWPPPVDAATTQDGGFPIRVAILFAVSLNLIAAGALTIARTATSALPWPLAWPTTALLLVVATAWIFVTAMRRIGAPLAGLVAAADRVGNGDLSVRVDEEGLPWLRSVASAFNVMTARLQGQQRERQALLADIAHELRTPVAVLQGRIEGMLDGIYPAEPARLRQLLEDTRLLGRLVEDLRTAAHADSGTLTLRKEPTDPGVLVDDVAASLRPQADRRQVRLVAVVSPDVPLLAVDPHRLREVLVNLTSNAIFHSPPGGTVEISCDADADAVTMRVLDRGAGIPPQDLSRVFDRFYKDPASTGSGLGLTIAKSLTLAHGGRIAAANRSGGGTTMAVTLPIDEKPTPHGNVARP